MPNLVSELILSVNGLAQGTKSPAYYGYAGPQFDAWLKVKNEQPHQTIVGRKTYEMLNGLPAAARDDGWLKTTTNPGWVFSSTLETVDWPGLEVVRSDLCDYIREAKLRGGNEIRTLGSLSIVRQLVAAGLVDCLRLIVCPLILPETGTEPLFSGMKDMQFELLDHKLLDGRVLVLDYRPNGPPPYA